MTRTTYSKVKQNDEVFIVSAGGQVPQWAIGMQGKVDRINRQGGIVVDLGYRAQRKFIVCKPENVILVKGKNVRT